VIVEVEKFSDFLSLTNLCLLLYHKIEGIIIAEIINILAIKAIKILCGVLFSEEVKFAFEVDFFELIIDTVKVVSVFDVFVIDFVSIDDIVAFVGIEEIIKAVVVVVVVVVLVFFVVVVEEVVFNVVLVVLLANAAEVGMVVVFFVVLVVQVIDVVAVVVVAVERVVVNVVLVALVV
jgi:hypothetical protein